MTWVRVAELGSLTFAPGALVAVDGVEYAVFELPGEDPPYRAVPNSCPHAGASLHDGDQSGHVLACLWHGWRFDLRSGACLTEPADAVRACPGRVREGMLELDL